MKTFFALALLLLITACSHPLEISGHGDIFSSNGAHNCILEEQPCNNLITGDYVVTYSAEPRAGWSFEGWEGCGDQFPDCSIDISSATVAEYWGEVMPPLRATFLEDAPRKKVIILLDNSSSMNIISQVGSEKPPYDPSATYQNAGFIDSRIYWSTNSDKPAPYGNRFFTSSSNRCESSFLPLANTGNVAVKAKRWRPANGSLQTITREVCNGSVVQDFCLPDPPGWEIETEQVWDGDSASWRRLSPFDTSPVHVDCQLDVLLAEEGNGPNQPTGLPNQPSAPNATNAEAFASSGLSNVNFGNTVYTWYTAHYLNWWYDTSIHAEEKTRLQVAQDVVSEVITETASIDFGLAVFNHNSDGAVFAQYNCPQGVCTIYNSEEDNGGRIVWHLKENMTATERSYLAGRSGLVSSLVATGNTPLTETTYEIYRYLTGHSPLYGLKQDNWGYDFWAGRDSALDSPNYDPKALEADLSQYKSPIAECGSTSVILMTAGLPSLDNDADNEIEALLDVTCNEYAAEGNSTVKNCLAEITRYMANNDLDDDASNGDQYGITYTIGFGTDQQLLKDAATNGKGQYFTASSSDELAEAFGKVIEGISNTPPSSCLSREPL